MQNVTHTVLTDAIGKDPANVIHVVRTHTRMTRALNRAWVCIIHFIVGLLSLQMTNRNEGSRRLKALGATRAHQLLSRGGNEHSLRGFGSVRIVCS